MHDAICPEEAQRSPTLEERRLLDERFTELYKNIRQLARRVRWSGANPTLNPTALAHEAYLKLCNRPPDLATKSSDEVISIFANAMLQILRDAARRKNAQKREFQKSPGTPDVPIDKALIVAEALDSLHRESPVLARVAQCRFVLGMTVSETASALAMSNRKVERLWQDVKEKLTGQFNSSNPEYDDRHIHS